MRSKYFFVTLIFLFSFFNCFSQYKVIKITDSISKYPIEKGFFYTLPQNYLVIHLQVTKTNKYKGPFSDYSDKLLGLSSIQDNQTIYSINNIDLSLGYEPDLSQQYFVCFPKKVNKSIYYQFSKNGLLLNKPNCTKKEELLPIQISFSGPSSKEKAQFEMYNNYSMYEQTDTTFETKLIDSAYVQVPKINKQMVVKTTDQKAQEALQEIKNIREAQWLLLTGEHEVDFSHLELMISSLKEKEQVYLSLFTGFSVSEEIDYVFYLPLPEKKDTIHIPLFTFSTNKGINNESSEVQDFYSIMLTNTFSTSQMTQFLNQSNNQNKKHFSTGFCYRIPEYYKVSFYLNQNELKQGSTLPINQYGIINMLPCNVSSFEIDPLTGSINNVLFK